MAPRQQKSIEKMVATNDFISAATIYATSLQVGKVKSAWFERDHDKMLTHAASRGQADGFPRPLPPYALHNSAAMRDAGILSGLGTVKALRQGRMRELYDREALQYEAELSGMGLSLVKPRD
ncbi:MAG: hypothetical protein WDW38_006870 [Sanguina aurantia]